MKLEAQNNGLIDFAVDENGNLKTEDSLQSAVIISLFTDRRAFPEDVLPDAHAGKHKITQDRRGWAGDALEDKIIGSRLWLLSRAKQTEETRRAAIEYAQEALQWLIDDKIATDIGITAEWHGQGRLDLKISITLSDGKEFALYFKNIISEAVHDI